MSFANFIKPQLNQKTDDQEWYLKAVEQDNPYAMLGIAILYKNGKGVDRDYAKAFEWFLKAAEQDDFVAQFNVGLCYEKGYGVEANAEEAFRWYEKAAEQGHKGAQKKLEQRQ